MEVNRTPSCFNTNNAAMVNFLEDEYRRHEEGLPPRSRLYHHQIEAVRKLQEYFNPQKNPNSSNIALVVLPTGCGKTGVAVLASYALIASRVLVITPSIIISRQIDKAYENFLLNKRVVTSAHDMQCVMPSKAVIMKSSEIHNGMQSTLMIVNAHKIGGQSNVRIEDIPRDHYDLVIVDEAHHYPALTWRLYLWITSTTVVDSF